MHKHPIGILLFAISASGLAFGQATIPNGPQNAGGISIIRAESKIAIGMQPPVESTQDLFNAGFRFTDYTNYTPQTFGQITTIDPCTIIVTNQTPPNPQALPTHSLDAGPVLNINGPNGMMSIPQTTSMTGSFYGMTLGGGIPLPPLPFPIPGLPGPKPLYLDPGDYTVDNGSGGADVGPFTATLTYPANLVWTNADSDLTIVRANGVELQWTGGDPAQMVEIQGVSGAPPNSGAFTCIVPNNGDFVVTSDVLNLLPATAVGAGPGSISTLSVGSGGQVNFTASGLDVGIFSYSTGASRTVVYQ